MSEKEAPRMPFGKHKGKFLSDVETEYLDWLIGRDLRDPLKTNVLNELKSRDEWRTGSFMEEKESERTEDDE